MVFVLVPAAVVHFDKAHPRFAETASEQALAPEITLATGPDGILPTDLVTLQNGIGFGGKIHQPRRSCLHAEAELHRLDHRLELGIVAAALPVIAIEPLDKI